MLLPIPLLPMAPLVADVALLLVLPLEPDEPLLVEVFVLLLLLLPEVVVDPEVVVSLDEVDVFESCLEGEDIDDVRDL